MKSLSRTIVIGFVGGSCIGCDQVTKVAAQQHLSDWGPVSFFGGIVRLSYVENPGGFLSLGAGLSPELRFWVFGVAVALVLALLAIRGVCDRTASPAQLVGIALLIGGGMGNLIDRANLGVVRDFLNVGIGPIRTGVFNVADLAITMGAAVVLWSWRRNIIRSEGEAT